MPITTEQIKELRDQTGVSVMQCKKALEEAGGDREKALVILRKAGADAAAKKQDRTFGSGAIQAYVHSTGSVGAMVLLLCETDFVAKNEEFKALARDIAMQVAATAPQFVSKDKITEDDKAAAKAVFTKEVEGKPEEMREKILEGKLDAYFRDKVLLEQPFIKNPEVTVGSLIDSAIQKFGEKIEIGHFTRLDTKR